MANEYANIQTTIIEELEVEYLPREYQCFDSFWEEDVVDLG